MAEPVVPDKVLTETVYWLRRFAADWALETPIRIHTREIADDGSPQWHRDFSDWLDGRVSNPHHPRNSERRLRTTKAFRRLRRIAVREYEVLYRIIVLGNSIEQVANWLNERAERNAKDDRYRRDDVIILVVSGVDKVIQWY